MIVRAGPWSLHLEARRLLDRTRTMAAKRDGRGAQLRLRDARLVEGTGREGLADLARIGVDLAEVLVPIVGEEGAARGVVPPRG